MHTLVDFTTRVKGVEYLISVLAITGFILFVEVLKPRPFKVLARHVREDLDHLKETGYGNALRTAGRILAAPFVGLAYVVALPFLFAYTFCRETAGLAGEGMARVLALAGRSAFFGWRPTEAYLAGRKARRGKKDKAGAEDPGKTEKPRES